MKTPAFQHIMDQKKLPVHLLIFLFSSVIALVYLISKPEESRNNALHLFIMLLIEIETFILLGTFFFKKLKPGLTRSKLTQKVLARFSLFMITCFILAFIITVLYSYFTQIYGGNLTRVITNFVKYGFNGWFKGTIGGLLFGAAVFIYVQWQDALGREQKLREENLVFQNETLKNQVNPHFLFNSLNTLSSLIPEQPENAEKFISRLSSIYRYILENGSADSVPLDSELSFMRDYFYLHQIRAGDKIHLEVKADGSGLRILPLSLQGLVENAIKHNMATRDKPLKIEVSLEGKNIVVKNNLQEMATQIKSTGIGLKNLSVRINLLTQRDLTIEKTEKQFVVKLPLLS